MNAISAAILVAASVFGTALPARGQDEGEKLARPLRLVEKAGFSDDDREVAGEFLAAHRAELRPAPHLLALQVRESRRWSRACDAYALPLPRRVDGELSELPAGLTRRIFDRAIVLLNRESGEVVDWVDVPDE